MKPLRPLITMTTDFGEKDGFVGAMKGIIYSIDPQARIVDISHGVPRQDVAAGAVVLRDACPHFPADTIHLAVIDPGVGSKRLPIVAVTETGLFVLPDNGLLSLVTQQFVLLAAYRLENPDWRSSFVSQTFHGRDIFAPAAAHLSLGAPPQTAGSRHGELVQLFWPEAERCGAEITGCIRSVDTYGNLETNIPNAWLAPGVRASLSAGTHTISGPSEAYTAVPQGELLFIRGSSGFVEIAANHANASALLGLSRRQKVALLIGGDEKTQVNRPR